MSHHRLRKAVAATTLILGITTVLGAADAGAQRSGNCDAGGRAASGYMNSRFRQRQCIQPGNAWMCNIKSARRYHVYNGQCVPDNDHDGIHDGHEHDYGTSTGSGDSDHDGFGDYFEVSYNNYWNQLPRPRRCASSALPHGAGSGMGVLPYFCF